MAGLAVMQYQFNGVTQIEAWEGIKVIPFKGTMENTKIYRNGKVTEWNGQVEVSPGDCVSVDYETGEIINMNQIVTFKDPQGRFLLKDILRQPVEEVQTMLTLARFNGVSQETVQEIWDFYQKYHIFEGPPGPSTEFVE